MKDRADKILVALKLARTRSQAKLLIEEGVVFYNGQQVAKTGQQIMAENVEVRKEVQYVGRGAHKLEGALEYFSIEVKSKTAADIGASTGGFTDLMLKRGAEKVYAVDVGHDQLARELREDPRVVNMEGVNIKNPLMLPEKVDLCVVDLSFISLRLTLKNIFALLKEKGEIVCLVKPQFEAGRKALKDGIVADKNERLKVLDGLYDWCKQNNFTVKNMMTSPVKGKNGNVEYFFYLSSSGSFCNKEMINIAMEET